MRITHAGNLLADTALDGHKSLAIEGRRSYVQRRLLRSPTARWADRGNASCRIAWTAQRHHASQDAAESYALQHPAAVMGIGNAVFVCGPSGDQQTLVMQGAALEARHLGTEGRSTIWAYTLTGPQPTDEFNLSVGMLASSVVLHAPSLADAGADTLVLGHIPSGAALHLHTLADQGSDTLAGATISSGAILYAASLADQGADSLAGVHIASAASIFAPGLGLQGGHIASAAALFAPSLQAANETLAGGHIASAAVLYAPSPVTYMTEANYDTLADDYWTSQGYDLSLAADRQTAHGLEEAKLANLGYTDPSGADFEADLFAGNALTYEAWKAASTTYP